MPKGFKAGGRTKGTPNKANSVLLDLVEAEAGAPLPVLLARIGTRAMADADYLLAVQAFARAAMFVYPRLQAIDPDKGNTAPPILVLDGVAQLDNYPGPVVRLEAPGGSDSPKKEVGSVISWIDGPDEA